MVARSVPVRKVGSDECAPDGSASAADFGPLALAFTGPSPGEGVAEVFSLIDGAIFTSSLYLT